MSENELYHHGILGMKWGVRRYQYKDGSLTPAGRKKAAKMRSDYTQLTGKNLRKHPESTKGSSSSGKSKSQDDDLRKKTDELRKQQDYLQAKKDVLTLQNQISAIQPKHVSAGKKFIQSYGPKIANSVWEGVAKPQLNNYLKKKLGIETTSESDHLAKRAKDAENRWKIAQNEDKLKARNKSIQERAQSEERLRDAEKQVNDYANSGYKNDRVYANGKDPSSNNTRYSREYSRTPLLESPAEKVSGTVEGEGTSRYKPKDGPIYDADYREVSSGASVNRGREYVNRISMNDVFLLEDRKRKK